MADQKTEDLAIAVCCFMNAELEEKGKKSYELVFGFNETDEDAEDISKQMQLDYVDLEKALNICYAREWFKPHSMGYGKFGAVVITEDGQAVARSAEMAKLKQPVAHESPNIYIAELNVTGPTQIGDNNTQNIENTFIQLIDAIDKTAVSKEEKAEAKGLLAKFLEHPVTNTVIGTGLNVITNHLMGGGK